MSNNEDIILKLQNVIREENRKQTETLSKDLETIKEVITDQKKKINILEKQVEELKLKNIKLEKEQRKNNIIIFNLEYADGDLLQYTITRLNEILKINIAESDINNIYAFGKQPTNKPIIIQFVSYLIKKKVLLNCFNLKNTDIKITDQLSLEERKERQILVEHLKYARAQQQKAHIRGNNLYIDGKRYLAKELITEQNTTEPEGKTANKTRVVQKLNTIPEASSSLEVTLSNVDKKRKIEATGYRASTRLEEKNKK